MKAKISKQYTLGLLYQRGALAITTHKNTKRTYKYPKVLIRTTNKNMEQRIKEALTQRRIKNTSYTTNKGNIGIEIREHKSIQKFLQLKEENGESWKNKEKYKEATELMKAKK